MARLASRLWRGWRAAGGRRWRIPRPLHWGELPGVGPAEGGSARSPTRTLDSAPARARGCRRPGRRASGPARRFATTTPRVRGRRARWPVRCSGPAHRIIPADARQLPARGPGSAGSARRAAGRRLPGRRAAAPSIRASASMSTSGALSPRSWPAKVSRGEGSPGSAAADRPSTDERPSRSRSSSRPIRAAQARADGPWAKTRSIRRAASRARGVWSPAGQDIWLCSLATSATCGGRARAASYGHPGAAPAVAGGAALKERGRDRIKRRRVTVAPGGSGDGGIALVLVAVGKIERRWPRT
jgi:hypothetical protein